MPLVIDRHPGTARETRALGVQARTLEIYARLGIVERALALGKRAAGVDLWADGRHTARVPLGDAGAALTPYPYVFSLDDTRWTLLVFGQRAPPTALHVLAAAADVRNDQTLARAHIPQPSFFLLRPDGHIGLCGATLDNDTLGRYLAQCVGKRAG